MYENNNLGVPQGNPGKGLGIASMVLGIVSLCLCCLWYIGIIIAIVGLVLGIVGLSKSKHVGLRNGMATAGIVMNAIMVALLPTLFALGVSLETFEGMM